MILLSKRVTKKGWREALKITSHDRLKLAGKRAIADGIRPLGNEGVSRSRDQTARLVFDNSNSSHLLST